MEWVFIGLGVLILFYGVFAGAFVLGNGIKIYRQSDKVSKIFLLVLLACCTVFVAIAVRQNQFIYYWDYGAYWSKSIIFLNNFKGNVSESLNMVYMSINSEEYNDLLPLLICFPLQMVGNSFARYVFICFVMFLLPAFIVLYACIQKIFYLFEIKTIRWFENIVTTFLIILFPPFYFAMLRGYVDVAILLPISLIIFLSIDIVLTEHKGRADYIKDIMIGLLLIIVLLFRRYTAFYVIGYVCSLCVYAVYELLSIKHDKRAFINCFKHFAVIGISSLGLLILFFREFLVRSLTSNYASAYVAYDAELLVKIQRIVERYGIVTVIPAIFALIYTLVKFRRLSKLVLFLWSSVLISVGCFFRIQQMGEHHIYIISVQIMLLVVIGIYELFLCCSRGLRRMIPVTLAVLNLGNFIVCYGPIKLQFPENVPKIFGVVYQPFIRSDIPVLQNMVEYLNSISEDKEIYVLASGSVLNCDILRSLYKPYSLDAVPAMSKTADIDLRDGFPLEFFDAQIIVTTEPIELHTAEGTQEVIRFLAQEVMDSESPLGACFMLDQTFMLDHGVEAKVYIRKSELSDKAIEYLKLYFTGLYPENEELFEKRFDQYLNNSG